MESDSLFYLLPIQIVPVEEGAIARRGATRLHVAGAAAAEVLQVIAAATAAGASRGAILANFPDSSHEAVDGLLGELIKRRFLAELPGDSTDKPLVGEEDRSDVFYWTLQSTAADVAREIGSPALAVIGVNAVSAALASGLREMGLADIVVVDHPLLQNVSFVDSSGTPEPRCWPHDPPVGFDDWADSGAQCDLIVATSDFGGLSTMREWNAFCLNQKIPFFSAVLHDYVGYAGPLVVPHSTACFECLIRRQDSNLESPFLIRATDDVAFQGQVVDGMLPFSAGLLGSVAAFEIYRYFARSTMGWRADTVIEIDLLASTMKPRKFLRLPRCPVCGTGSRSGRVAVERVELPGNPQEA